MTITIGSLFSGIGGLELGLEWSGLGPVIWQAEKDLYCLKVLEKHWPSVKRYQDVTEVTGSAEKPDIICGGFPCQDISSAGKGAGLTGPRSGLWFEFYRIVHEIEPEWVVVENVGSAATRWVDAVRGALELIGYETLPIPLSAQDVGAPHFRRRVFIVARAVDTWAKRQWRSGGAFTVSDSQCGHIRNEPKWVPSRRAEGVQWQRQTQSTHNGEKRLVADADKKRRHGRTGEGEEETRRRQPTNGGCSVADSNGKSKIGVTKSWQERHPWAFEPDVGRVANGVPARMDRLRALGNSVVPQCAEVIGYVVQQLL